jgi:hypothetical protein
MIASITKMFVAVVTLRLQEEENWISTNRSIHLSVGIDLKIFQMQEKLPSAIY